MLAFPADFTKFGSGGALVWMEGFVPNGGNSIISYFWCEDVAVEESRVVEAGGKISNQNSELVNLVLLLYFTIRKEI